MIDLAGGLYGLMFESNDIWKTQRRFALHSLKDIGFSSPSVKVSERYRLSQLSFSSIIISPFSQIHVSCQAEIDALADILYVVYGFAVSLGVDIEPFLDEVHKNNLTKVGPNGEVIRREDGKVLKPANYVPVDLFAIYERVYLNV